MKNIYRIGLIICVLCGFGAHSFAQNVTNITAMQVGKNIHVSYDLDEESDILIYVSTNGGKTFSEPLKQVSGDVGENISPGHKTIVWDVLAEQEKLEGDEIVFQVEATGLNKQNLTFTVDGVSFKMVFVKGGTFTVGSNSGNSKPEHEVTLSEFWIGETEVTQGLWKAVMNTSIRGQLDAPDDPLRGEGSDYPMYYVNHSDVSDFCDKLNNKLESQLPLGFRFALPTEAQWEYAAKGGCKSKGYKYSGSDKLNDVAWHYGNSGGFLIKNTHPVKGKQANELGLYDMSGNVCEWCQDWYAKYSSSPQTNPKGPSGGSNRVLRGGGWDGGIMEVTGRIQISPGIRSGNIGFRIALVQE